MEDVQSSEMSNEINVTTSNDLARVLSTVPVRPLSSKSTTTIYRVDNHSNNLCQALYKCTLSEPQFCDVIVRLGYNKQEFKAHGSVLAACSTFFKNILTKPDTQYAKNVVVLPDFIHPEGLEPVLSFIYTGDLGVNEENISGVYQVAYLFELANVITLCQKYVEAHNLPHNLPNLSTTQLDNTSAESKYSAKLDGTNQLESNPASSQNLFADKENYTISNTENIPQVSTKNGVDSSQNCNTVECSGGTVLAGLLNPGQKTTNTCSVFDMSSTQDRNNHSDKSSNAAHQGNVADKDPSAELSPVRRSVRKLAVQNRKLAFGKSTSNPLTAKKKCDKRPQKSKDDGQGKQQKMKVESLPANNSDVQVQAKNKIDASLKFTDPAKYIAELIDKNSNMLNDRATDTESGGIKIVTKGKITYIYPEGCDSVTITPTTPTNIVAENMKMNDAGLPYEKIVDPLTCGDCNITFPSALTREQHVQDKHKGQTSHLKQIMFQCLNCPFSTDFLRNMWFHCHWKHTYPLPDTLRQYCCGLCDYRAPAQGNIEVHIRRIHTHERPLMCDVCGQFFKSLDTLRGHRFYRHQDIYPFQCNVCEKQFKRRHKLDVHMRIHMGFKPFSCPECSYATYTKFNLKDHVRKRHLKELDGTVKP